MLIKPVNLILPVESRFWRTSSRTSYDKVPVVTLPFIAARKTFVDGVKKTTEDVGKLLREMNETLRDSVVGAAATVGEMHALLTPKCRGELQVRCHPSILLYPLGEMSKSFDMPFVCLSVTSSKTIYNYLSHKQCSSVCLWTHISVRFACIEMDFYK